MEEIAEGFDIIVEAYPEYLGSLSYALQSWPRLTTAYALIVLPLAILFIYLLGRLKPSFFRTLLQCVIAALVLLPGAYGDGGLIFIPLAGALAAAIAHLSPALLFYNIGLLVVALGLALLASVVIHALVVRHLRHAT